MKIGFPTIDFRFGTEKLQEVKDIRITTSFQHVFPRAISAAGPKVGRKVRDSGYDSGNDSDSGQGRRWGARRR